MPMPTHLILKDAGVDVGFFATKYTTGRTTGAPSNAASIGTGIFPSIPAKGETLTQYAGTGTLNGVSINVEGQTFFVGASAPEMVGPEGMIRRGSEDYCKTPGYQALFLGALWHIARYHNVQKTLVLENLVVGLPLSTLKTHKEYLKDACTGIHQVPCHSRPGETITVDVKNVHVTPQPQGSVVNYMNSQSGSKIKEDHVVLVLDMGGGTFDWYACNGNLRPLYKLCGATNTGTLSCTTEICRSIRPSLASSTIAIERVDKAIRTKADSFEIGGQTYSMADYWPMVVSHVQSSFDEMRAAVGELFLVVDHIILSGGGAHILQMALEEKYPEISSRIHIDGDHVFGNVKGFHQIAEAYSED